MSRFIPNVFQNPDLGLGDCVMLLDNVLSLLQSLFLFLLISFLSYLLTFNDFDIFRDIGMNPT